MRFNVLIGLLMLGFSYAAMSADVKKSIHTENAPAPIGIYSQAIRFGDTVYMSGQIGINPKTGELVSEKFKDQVRQVFENISVVAKAAGGNMNDVLKLTIYMTDLKDFSDLNTVMAEYFEQPYPARSAIEIKALPKKSVVEMEAVMAVGK